MKKTLATLMAVALVGAAFVAPADAKKKKKKKKPPPPPACETYVPGELGAEAETVVVTDEHTEEAPAVFEFSLDPYFFEGAATSTLGQAPQTTVNVQVDSAAEAAGLYVTFEFDTRRDYDLWAYYPTGEEAASSHGFNPLIETQGQPAPADQSNTASNHAGETTATSENVVGLITADCDGYTVEAYNYFGEGGDFELKFWLGEGQTEPKAKEA